MEIVVDNNDSDRQSAGKDDDETFSERFFALSEMFPEPVRNFTGRVVDATMGSLKTVYIFSCNAAWIVFTSAAILVAPVVFETERAKMKKTDSNQRMQVLYGPGAS